MDLVEFLTARYDEEAADIRDGIAAGESNISTLDLLDVEAKRKAVVACAHFLHDSGAGPDPCAAAVLAALASRYADHADYDEAWRP